MKYEFPKPRPGQTVGLLGGSFDPAHEGHAHITRAALRRFGLDHVWWLVSPGNPLKAEGPADMARRVAHARQVMQHPKVTITDVEQHLGTRFTAETIKRLQAIYPDVKFVWLMGADNLAQLHRWQDWQDIMKRVPVGVIARPGHGARARGSKAAQIFREARLPFWQSWSLAHAKAPAWCFINLPLSHASSTAIRERGEWKKKAKTK